MIYKVLNPDIRIVDSKSYKKDTTLIEKYQEKIITSMEISNKENSNPFICSDSDNLKPIKISNKMDNSPTKRRYLSVDPKQCSEEKYPTFRDPNRFLVSSENVRTDINNVELNDIKIEKQDCHSALNYFKNMKKTNIHASRPNFKINKSETRQNFKKEIMEKFIQLP